MKNEPRLKITLYANAIKIKGTAENVKNTWAVLMAYYGENTKVVEVIKQEGGE